MVCGSDAPRALVASTVDLSSGDMAQLIPEEEQRRPDTQLQNAAAVAASGMRRETPVRTEICRHSAGHAFQTGSNKNQAL